MALDIKRIGNFVRRDPLVHFVALAGLLFLASALWSGGAREAIRVDKATQDFLIKQRADLLLRALTPEEEQKVVEDFVEEEILVREAKKRGLDNSGRIRRLMVQNLRFLLKGDLAKPTPADLRTFFEKNQKRYESPPTLTLDHVFFANPEQVPEATLSQLKEGADHNAMGDFNSFMGRKVAAASQRQLVGLFGPDAAREILAIEDDDWHGPIVSPRGAHFVRITERNPASLPSFEDAASWIESEWMMANQREILNRQLEAMRPNYQIIVEPRGTAGDG
jgi:parvulin-like peptidyl-prolyl isomerase